MDSEAINRWLSIAALALSCVNMIWVMVSRSGHKAEAKLDGHEKKLTDHDRRVQALEGEMRHVPTKEDLSRVQLALTALEGRVAHVDHAVGAVSHTVRRIDDFLREDK